MFGRNRREEPVDIDEMRRRRSVPSMIDLTGSTFRGEISARVPRGWWVKASTTVIAPDGQANVIASSEPIEPDLGSRDYAVSQGDLLRKEFPGFHELSFEPVTAFGGREAFQREFTWSPPDGVQVRQIQLYFAEDGRGFTATATTPVYSFDRMEADLRDILHRLSLP
jgi:hypothetical protein